MTDADGEPDDKKCTGAVCGLFGLCAVECTADEECPIASLGTAPAAGKNWDYVPCVKGKCTPKE